TLVRRAGLYDVHLARRPRDDTPRPIVAKLVLAADAQRARRTLHSAFQLFGRPLGYSPERMERLKRMVDDHDAAALLRAFTGQSPHRIGGVELSAARRWLRGRLNMGWSDDGALLTRPAMLEVAQKSEQAPDRDNRVVLGSERDALGCRVAELRWRWTE